MSICEGCANIDIGQYMIADDESSFLKAFDNEECNWCIHHPGTELVDNFKKRKGRKRKLK